MNDEFRIEFGNRIRNCREKARLSQGELAELTGLSSTFISCVERGIHSINAENLARICEALHISADYILFGKTRNDMDAGLQRSCTWMAKQNQDRQVKLNKMLEIIMEIMDE